MSVGEMGKKKVERENKRKGGIGLRMLAGIVLETGSIKKDNKETVVPLREQLFCSTSFRKE